MKVFTPSCWSQPQSSWEAAMEAEELCCHAGLQKAEHSWTGENKALTGGIMVVWAGWGVSFPEGTRAVSFHSWPTMLL